MTPALSSPLSSPLFWHLLDHLWQSTLFALVVALLVLSLRKASAAVRHGLWLAASVKFLIPFAVLAAAGAWLAPDVRLPAPAAPAAVLKTAAEPFSQTLAPASREPAQAPKAALAPAPEAEAPTLQAPAAPALAAPATQPGFRLDPIPVLLALWGLGSLAILVRWAMRWRRLDRAVRAAKPVAWPAPMPVRASSWLIEPGLAGLIRPVLVVPETLPARLTRSEIEAIVAHEASHLRRRDNLTAALHMLVEALFWFHPLVWWIGGRMIVERELACDEAVVRAGHDRAAYARSLLESCRHYIQSPLDCMAGASGPNLKTRIETIMTAPLAGPLSPLKKALLLGAAACAFATPVMAGLVSPEVQKAAAPFVAAVKAIAAPAGALAAPSEAPADASAPQQPLVVAQESRLIASLPSVAPIAAPPPSPIQDVAEPLVVAAAPPRPAAEPAPVQTASADPRAEAAAFVETYAAATAKRAIARWAQPICVRIEAPASHEADALGVAVRQRIDEVAKAVGVQVESADCATPDVEVGLTDDPQATLDFVVKTKRRALGDASSGTRSATTVTLPIQAWYETNGKDVAQNDAGDLKALADYRREDARSALITPVLYQQSAPGPGQPTVSSNSYYGGNANAPALEQAPVGGAPNFGAVGAPYPNFAGTDRPGAHPFALWAKRQFVNALVIVDLRRTRGAGPRAVADYVAMLALAQPRSLGACQALPSVTDLFAACPGRPAPTGLTAADIAYLHALYAGDEKSRVDHPALVAQVVDGMASRLATDGAHARADAAPPPAPEKPVRPAAFREGQGNSARLELASYASAPEASALAADFVRANARVGQFGYTVRWQEPLCVKVKGLTPEQDAAVASRIDAVAQTLSQKVYSGLHQSCPQPNVWVLFTGDPQTLLNAIVARNPRVLGDAHSDTKGVRTVTRPIQAWRQTECIWISCAPEFFPQKPFEAMVLVDAKRVGGTNLGAIADYVAMLVLADPRGLDQCQALPSVLHLFAGACPERAVPSGLTRGDLAYLKALYTAGNPITTRDWNWQQHGGSIYQVAGRMGMLLAGSGNLPEPGAKPVRHD